MCIFQLTSKQNKTRLDAEKAGKVHLQYHHRFMFLFTYFLLCKVLLCTRVFIVDVLRYLYKKIRSMEIWNKNNREIS